MRGIAAAVVLPGLMLLGSRADAQTMRLTGQITEVRDGGRLAAHCPGCTDGGTVTLELNLVTPECRKQRIQCSEGFYTLGKNEPNRLTVTAGNVSWTSDFGTVYASARTQTGRTSFYIAGGAEAIQSGSPQSLIQPRIAPGSTLPGIVYDGGRIVAGRSASLPMPGARWEEPRGAVGGSFLVFACRPGRGSAGRSVECTDQVGSVEFAIRSLATGSAAAASSPALVVFVGGANDASSERMLGVYRRWNPPSPGVSKRYFPHDGEQQIRAEIERFLAEQPNGNVVLVGHSWGGNTVVNAARYLRPARRIALLITLDPVPHPYAGNPSAPDPRRSPRPRAWQPPPPKPQNVEVWVNVWPGDRNGTPKCGRGDWVAGVGENGVPWGHIPGLPPVRGGTDHCDAQGMFDKQEVQDALAAVLGAPSS